MLTHAWRLSVRAARLRCPNCGGRPAFLTWTKMSPNCPVCGLRFERGERGYWLGAYFFNLMAMETVFTLWFLVFLVATWPDPPWDTLQWQITVLMVLFPVAFFPFSKTFFLAFDLLVRPPTDEDFAAPREPSRPHRQHEEPPRRDGG
jgi:uncharacterized protein (DUF983 family)